VWDIGMEELSMDLRFRSVLDLVGGFLLLSSNSDAERNMSSSLSSSPDVGSKRPNPVKEVILF